MKYVKKKIMKKKINTIIIHFYINIKNYPLKNHYFFDNIAKYNLFIINKQ